MAKCAMIVAPGVDVETYADAETRGILLMFERVAMTTVHGIDVGK